MDDRQGPGSTAEFARPDFSAPAPQPYGSQDRSGQDPASTGQFARPDFGQQQPARSQDQGLLYAASARPGRRGLRSSASARHARR